MKAKLKKLQEKQDAARVLMKKVFDEAGSDMDMGKVKEIAGTSQEKVTAIRKMNDEQTTLGKEIEDLQGLMTAKDASDKAEEETLRKSRLRHPGSKNDKDQNAHEGIGKAFIRLKAHLKENKHQEIELGEGVGLKTLFETTAGWAPESFRTGRVVDKAVRPIQVLDLIPMGQTDNAAILYMEETTFTNAAVEVGEGLGYPESALALTEKTSPVRKIATFLPVTDEQLDDVRQVQGYINNRLPFMLEQRLDSQVLNGDGAGVNLTGILNASGLQTQAKGGDETPDAIFKAMTLIRLNGRAIADGIVLHQTDWQAVRLLKTNDGLYIWGMPSEAGPERMWGLPVAQSDAIPLGTGLVGAFRPHSELIERSGIAVKVSDSHSDFFIKGKQAIRAEMRVAFVVYRGAAFAQVTGL